MVVIWDYFGVVAHDDFWKHARLLAQKMGNEPDMVSASRAVNDGNLSWEEFCKRVAVDTGVSYELVRDRYSRHRINGDVVMAVKDLQNNARHVLLSNASHEHLLPIMVELGLDTLFEQVFVSSLIGYSKPDSRAFQAVLDAMIIEPHEAIMVDDILENVESARSVGLRAIHYTRGIDVGAILRSGEYLDL